jgi:hypothetical protein
MIRADESLSMSFLLGIDGPARSPFQHIGFRFDGLSRHTQPTYNNTPSSLHNGSYSYLIGFSSGP